MGCVRNEGSSPRMKCCDCGSPSEMRSISQKGAKEEEVAAAAANAAKLPLSNLKQFLECTTPKIHLHYLPKSCLWDNCVRRWRPSDAVPFFSLGELWDFFSEWSAYGAGVPLVLHGQESVVQYYVPYLSALQLYTGSSVRPCLNFNKKNGVDSDASESSDYRDTCSEESEASSSDNDDCYTSQGRGQLRSAFWKMCQSGFCSNGTAKVKNFQAPLTSLHESSSDDDDDDGNDVVDDAKHLVMNYFEDSAPYSRVPLVDKIAELARSFPEIRTLRSVDLLPISWFSIAWYPIYRIPTGPTLRDLATCFLTFHSLSTQKQEGGECSSNEGKLQPFGLSSYKLRGAFWTSAGSVDKHLASSLHNQAESWLQDLHVRHPDFDFFAARSPARR